MTPWNACPYQISDDSSVDRVQDLLGSAHVGYLPLRDSEGRCTGLVTQASLHSFLARSWYTQHTPVRATAHERGPFARPGMALGVAALAMKARRLAVWPVVDDDGRHLGVLTDQRVTALLGAAAP